MKKKIARYLLIALLVGLCGCGVSSADGQVADQLENAALSSVEADAVILDKQAEEALPDTEGAEMNISFDFETKTVMLNSGYKMPIKRNWYLQSFG